MKDADIIIISLLSLVTVLVVVGFQAVLEQTRPRVIYVHRGGKDDATAAADAVVK